jgi:hypothetical protein
MKLKKAQKGELSALASRLRTLVFREGILEGTVTNMTVGESRRTTFTDKVDGKTRCLYVPQRHLQEVERLSANWREVKSILKEMSDVYREQMRVRMKDSPRGSASSTATVPVKGRRKTLKAKKSSKK